MRIVIQSVSDDPVGNNIAVCHDNEHLITIVKLNLNQTTDKAETEQYQFVATREEILAWSDKGKDLDTPITVNEGHFLEPRTVKAIKMVVKGELHAA